MHVHRILVEMVESVQTSVLSTPAHAHHVGLDKTVKGVSYLSVIIYKHLA